MEVLNFLRNDNSLFLRFYQSSFTFGFLKVNFYNKPVTLKWVQIGFERLC
jgi:hypothetical protein